MLADSLLKKRRLIPVKELLALLECMEDDSLADTWLNTMLRKIKIKVMSNRYPGMLRNVFNKFDAKN